MKVSFNSPTTFSIAIPVGVLAVSGTRRSSTSSVVYSCISCLRLNSGVAVPVAFAIADFFATQYVMFHPRYYHVDKPYMVKEAGGEYRIPFMIVQPFVY